MRGEQRVKSCFLASWLALALTAAGVGEAAAQRPQRYQPSRPTLSPYLNLLRNNNSAIPNYYSFVRPYQNQQALNQLQGEQLGFQNAQIGRVQAELLQQPAPGPVTGTPSWFRQPGTRTYFLNSSRYFGRAGRP